MTQFWCQNQTQSYDFRNQITEQLKWYLFVNAVNSNQYKEISHDISNNEISGLPNTMKVPTTKFPPPFEPKFRYGKNCFLLTRGTFSINLYGFLRFHLANKLNKNFIALESHLKKKTKKTVTVRESWDLLF